MRFAVAIISPPNYLHSEATREVAESIHYGLLGLGHDSIMTSQTDIADRRYIILCPNLLNLCDIQLRPDSILYNLEQVSPDTIWFPDSTVALFRRFRVWDYSQRNIEKLVPLGITNVQLLPIGYVPQLTRIPPAKEEDTDVLFYGSINDRRRNVLMALGGRGIKTRILFGVYGAARDEAIARSKIVLNLHFFEAKVFEAVRVSYLLANRRFVISERGSDATEEEAFSRGVVFADYDDLVDVCAEYVERADERHRIAEAGFEIMQHRDMKDYLQRAIASL